MVRIERKYPFGRKLLLFGVYDIIDRLKGRTDYDEASGKITSVLTVFERQSTFAFEVHQTDGGSRLVIELLTSADGLSEQGQERAVHFLADSIDQHAENTLAGKDIPKQLKAH